MVMMSQWYDEAGLVSKVALVTKDSTGFLLCGSNYPKIHCALDNLRRKHAVIGR